MRISKKNCLVTLRVCLAEHISATEDTKRPNKLYHKGIMSHYDTDEPYGEEIVDIGTTFQERAVTIRYRPRKIDCNVQNGYLSKCSITITVRSDSGSSYTIRRKQGGEYEPVSWFTWVKKRY